MISILSLRSISTSIFVSFAISVFAPIQAQDYEVRIKAISEKMASHARDALKDETVMARLIDRTGNFARGAVNSVPFAPKWKKPIGEVRQDFFAATQLLHDIANDSKLDDSKKSALVEDLAEQIGTSLNKFTEDYADPLDARLLDAWKNASTPVERFGSWFLSRILFFPVSVARDAIESLWPFDSRVRASHGPRRMSDGTVRFHAPDAMPFFGQDARINATARGILSDARIVFNDAVRNPARAPESGKALNVMLDQMQYAEPIRYASFNSFTLFMYTAAQVYLLFAPPFQMATEPTVLGGLLTGVLGFAIPLQVFKTLHKSNSGYSVFKQYRRLRQAGMSAPSRWIQNTWQPLRAGFRVFMGGSCVDAVSELGKRSRRRN